MLTICRRLGKEEDRRTYIEKMKVAHSDHPWTCEYLRKEQLKMVQTAAVAEKGRGLWSTQRGQMLSLSLPSLADMRNSYHLGNYQKCINLARHVSCPSDMEAKDLWIALAAIASGSPSFPLDRFKEIKKTSYVAVCRFARFQNPAETPDILNTLEDELCHGKFKADEVNCITGALMMASVGNVDDGLIMLYKCASIHTRAVAVELLLKIDRLDSAMEEVEWMMQIDESSILTQLARASVNLAISRRKLSDSLDIYTSLTEQHGRSTLLLTEKAEIFLLQGKFEDAELVLQKAYEIDSGNPKVLVPLISVTDRLGHHKMRNIYVETMKEKHPNHPWTIDYVLKERMGDGAAMGNGH